MALYWVVIQSDVYSPISALNMFGAQLNMSEMYLKFTLVAVVVLAAIIAASARGAHPAVRSLFSLRGVAYGHTSAVLIVSGFGMGIAIAGLMLDAEALVIFGMALQALWALGMTFVLLDIMAAMHPNEITLVALESYILQAAISIVFHAIGLTEPYGAVLAAAPLASSILVLVVQRRALSQQRDQESSTNSAGFRTDFSQLSRGILVWGLAFLVFYTVMTRAMPVPAEHGRILGGAGLLTCVAELVITLVMLAICRHVSWSSALEITLFCLLSITSAIGFFLAIPLSAIGSYYYKRIIVGSMHCLSVFLFICLAVMCRGKRLSAEVPAIMFQYACNILPQFIANLLMLEVFSHMEQERLASYTNIIAAFGLLLICVATISMLLHRAYSDHRKEQERRQSKLNGACDEIARRWGLSDREREVAISIYQGMSAQEIAQSMSIAESTVKTHTKHIYGKLGVHTRSELSQLVSSFMDE